MTTNSREGQDRKFTVKATLGKATMRMMRHIKIGIVLCGVILAAVGGASVSRADDVFVWQFQDIQPGIQDAQASTVDSQGNLIITGYTDESGDDDFYTIKVSSDGQSLLWAARYVHPQGDDWAVAVAVDGNDDVIVSGFVFNGVNNDIAVIKYDGATGNQTWAHPFILNGTANGNDIPRSLTVDVLNNIYVAGYSQAGGTTGDNAILFKLSPAGPNTDGAPIWQAHYNGPASGDDRFNMVSAGVDGLAVAGYSSVMHNGTRQDFDYLTIKFDYAGSVLWQKTFDNGSDNDLAYYLDMDSAGNVIVTGEALTSGRHDMVTIKYSAADGQQLWLTPYSAGSPNIPRALVVDNDDEVYVTGNTFTNTGKDDFYTARYAGANGLPVWEKVFDSGANNSDVPQALALDKTGGLYVSGSTHKETTGDDDFQTLKYNKANGNQIWQQAQDGPPAGGNQQPVGVAVAMGIAADGHVYVAGWSQQALDDLDYFAVKYNADLLNAPTGLTATVVSQTRVDLTWQDNSASPNNEDNFCIERCQGFGCSDYSDLTCAVGQDQTSYSDTSANSDTWYSYRVKGQSTMLGFSLSSPPASVLSTIINYPAPEWLYTHNDADGLDDQALAIAMGSDNNPVATGMSATVNSQFDYYTIKFDRTNAATPFWVDDYDGPDGQGDMGICLAVDNNNDVVVSGFSSINSGQGINTNDIFTIKYASTGPDIYTGFPLWTAQYNGPGNGDDRSTAVSSAADGSNHTVVTGYGKNANANDDIYLIKYKPAYDATAGQEVWAITPFDGGSDDYPSTTAFTPDNDVVVVGKTYNANGGSDLFISKYRGTDGSLISGWPYTHDFGHGVDGINAMAVATDGSIYVAGYAMNAAGNLDIYLNKFNGSGLPQWGSGKIIDGDGHGYDEAMAIAIDPNDGDIVVGATITSASGSMDFEILRYQPDGTIRWRKTLDRIDHDEMLVGMALSPSGEICLVGETENGTNTDVLAVKYDHLNNLIGSTKFDNGYDDFATAIAVNRLGEFFISGYSATGNQANDDYDFVVFRFNGQELQAPSPFVATGHNTTVDLSWTENDADISGYKLYRKNGACAAGGSGFGQSDLILTAAKGTTAYTNSGLNIGSTYCYGIEAYRLATSEASRIIEQEVATTTPVPPSNLMAIVKNTSEVEVCWHDNSASEDGFAVQRCTGVDCDFSEVTTLFAPAELDAFATATCLVDTSACDTGEGKNFRYRVQSYKVNAWNSGFAEATDTLTVPGLMVPSGLSASRVSDARVDLQWTDNTVDETDLTIERCQGAGCVNFVEVGAVSSVKGNALLLEMDEATWNGTPGQIIDYSGKARAATAFGGASTTTDAHKDRSGTLDGSNDYLTAPLTIDQSSNSTGVTMMAWIKPTSTSGSTRYLFSTEDGSSGQVRNSWGLLRNGATWQVATGEAVRATNVAVDSGQWQHVAVVFAPGTGVRFYKNGVETTIAYLGYHDSSANFTIGRQGVLGQNYFDGRVDEVAVYNRALPAAEVQKLYSQGVFPESTGQKWFTDASVSANLDYQYRIKARKQTDCGTDLSTPSNVIALFTAPLPPQPVTATLIKPGVVTLTWTPQTTTHTGFQVERCNGAGCTNFTVLTSNLGATAVKYTDNTACFGSDGVNLYQVKALGPWGVSAPSAVAQTTSVASPGPVGLTANPVTEASVTLNWTYSDANRDGFSVQRCNGAQATCDQSSANFTEVVGSPFSGQDPSLLALWKMDDSSWTGVAGEVVDSSGHGHHGTAVNGAVLDSPGAVSSYGAGVFDGVNDYINTDLTIDQSGTTAGATFMAWVYPTEQSYAYKSVFSNNNGGTGWGLSIYNGSWYLDTGYGTYYGGPATLNTWQHVAVVFNPISGVKFYLNGGGQSSTIYMSYKAISGPVNIGRDPVLGKYFVGRIDEVALFSRPLSDQEVSQFYNHNGPITFTDTNGIGTGLTYTYRVTPFVNTICGDWGASATAVEMAITTPAAPIAPDTLTVTQKSSTELDLAWNSKTTSESGFVIERCLGSTCDFSTHDSFQVGAGVTTYNDTSVCQGQTYRYRVKAVQGTAAPWEWETTFTSPVSKATLTAGPVTLNVSVVSESEVDVSWNDVNQDEDAYELSRCQTEAGVIACDQAAQFTVIDTFPGTVSGALLHYRMDEAAWAGVSGEVKDASGNNRHGIAYSGAATVATGRFGRAGSFPGASSYVSTPLTTNQARNSAGVTMEAWAYPTSSDANPRSVLSTENGGTDWGIIVQNGKWYVNTGQSQYDTGLTVDLNAWQHVAAVFTPSSGIKFYKNETVVSINEIDYDLSSAALVIGRQANSSSQYYCFQGRLDEVMAYGRPLTAVEVAAHAGYQEKTLYTYNDTTVEHSNTYYYKVTARKAADCGWSKETTMSAATPAPPPPTNLNVVSSDTTSGALHWTENNGSETGYKVSRCEGASGACASPVLTNLPADSTDFSDDTLCPGQIYTYRVWAEGAWGQTAFAEKALTTPAQPATPINLSANRGSEVEIDLTWDYAEGDETGLTLERCLGANCTTLNLPPGTSSYSDNELTPDTEYCYRVGIYKTASCGWETTLAGPACARTSLNDDSLTTTPANTTTVDLAWSDTTQTETTSTVERCEGDLQSCCNGDPAACLGPFATVAGIGPNEHTHADNSACAGNTYTYRVNSESLGLSRGNNGCWTKRAPLTFTSFPAKAGVEVVIPYQTGMRADFADIRFYDATAHRELQYWIKQKTNSTSATVWLMTGANPAIYLYYGNPAATDGSSTDALFTEVYDEFQGTVVNSQKWTVLDSAADKISQNNGLKFVYKNTSQDAAVISTKTFERAAGNELFIDFTVGADTSFANESIHMGWEQDQTASAAWSGNGAHLLYLTSSGSHYMQYLYEDTASVSFPKVLYNDLTRYQMKIVLNGGAGAKYYLRGGAYPDWRLLTETTVARPDDDVLRIGFHQASHNVTIHQVTVKHASAQRGATVNFAAAEGDGSTCLSFTHTWTGTPTLAAQALMPPVAAPSGLTAIAVDGAVALAWTAGTGDESEFRVERDCGSGFVQIDAAPSGSTGYTDTTMPASTTCSYQIKGHKEAPCPWTSSPSDPAQLLAPPAGPVVTATAENAFQVRLDWNDATDEDGYEVETMIFNGVWMPVATLPADQVSFTDNHGINPGTQYTYRVRARRAAERSAWGQDTATTPTYTPGTATCPLP